MEEVQFKAFPKSFLAAIFPFLLTLSILLASIPTKVFPNIVIFYFAIFTSVILASGLVGFGRFIEELGFDVNKEYWRIPVLIFVGLITGYICFRLVAVGLVAHPFPMDLALTLTLLATPPFFSTLNWIFVACNDVISDLLCLAPNSNGFICMMVHPSSIRVSRSLSLEFRVFERIDFSSSYK